MPFNDNQLFYAALYWTAILPGGQAFVDDICVAHGKPFYPVTAPAHENAAALDPVTQEQATCFMDALYGFLKDGKMHLSHPSSGQDGEYFGLKKQSVTDKKYFPFVPAIEHALEAAGLDRNILPQKNYPGVFGRDNGQLFARTENGWWEDLQYPGRPALDVKSMPEFETKDLAQSPRVEWEIFYRIVPLEPGQEYAYGWKTVGGSYSEFKDIAMGGEILVVPHNKANDLSQVSDAEILRGLPVKGAQPIFSPEQYTPGYVDDIYNYRIETSDDPRFVRHLTVMPCMDVTENIQIGFGSSFAIARPGDKIVAEGAAAPRIFRKESIDNGGICLRPVTSAPLPRISPKN